MAGKEEGAALDEYNTLADRTSDLGNRIHVSLDFLCENSTNLPQVLVHLLSHGLLKQRESEVIENEKSNYDRFRQLFTFIIPRLGHWDSFQHFVKAFKTSGNEHILKKLKNAVVAKRFTPLALEASSSVRFNMREPIPSFFGREKFLRELHKHILQSKRPSTNVTTTSTIISRISVVTGHGGIGKSETVRKYIHSYGHFYQHVVWIDAEEHATAESQFRSLALNELQLPSKDMDNKDKDFDVILKEIYERLCTSNTLIVLDNAEALYDSEPQRHGISRFLPKVLPPTNLKPFVLMTSRQLDWPDLHPMPLPLWTPQESIAFILRQLKLEENDANGKDVATLSETFGGLPLAIQAAASVILQESKRNKLMGKDIYTIQHLLRDYNQGKRGILKKLPISSPGTQPLMFLWKVSLDKIRQQPNGHFATQILNVLAHLSPTNIPKDLLTFIFSCDEEPSLKKAVELLVDYSFIHNSKTYFSIHRILQDVTLAHLEAPTEEHSKEGELLLPTHPLIRISAATKEYWLTVPKSSEAYDAVHDNLVHVTMSHVLPKAQNPSETDLHFIEFTEFVLEEIKNTRWVDAEKCCRVLLSYFTSSALPSHSPSPFKSPNFKKVQYIRRQLVGILELMGRYKEAVDICKEILSSFNSLENQTDVMSEILDTKHCLAMILTSQEEYEEAIKLFYNILDLRYKLYGLTHRFTLETKNNLALALENSGRVSEAKTLYAQILEVQMKDLGPLHLDTLSTKQNTAMILVNEGRYDDALKILREVMEVRERELGPLHTKTLTSKQCMADVLDQQGKNEDALGIYSHVISCYEKASAVSHPGCLWAKHNRALLLGKQGKLVEAEEVLRHVMDIQERLLGPSHNDTLATKHDVAWAMEIQGNNVEALKLSTEVLELKTKQLGHMHPSTLYTNNFIGWLQMKMGNFEKAESIAKEVLAARYATLPKDYPDIKNTENLYRKIRLRNEPQKDDDSCKPT